jgi:hypothetical protein
VDSPTRQASRVRVWAPRLVLLRPAPLPGYGEEQKRYRACAEAAGELAPLLARPGEQPRAVLGLQDGFEPSLGPIIDWLPLLGLLRP